MRINVIGSGAMGSLFGGLLAESGQNVTLYDRNSQHVNRIEKNGLKISTPENHQEIIDVKATDNLSSLEKPDLAIIFVKSKDTRQVMEETSKTYGEKTDVLTLQNGLGNPEIIAKHIPEKNIIAGVTSHGSTKKKPGHIMHAGEGPTIVGRYFAENDKTVDNIATVLTSAGFETSVSENIRDKIWEKILVNIGINLPTALARVKNGILIETDAGNRLIETLVKEAKPVAEKGEIRIREDILDHVKKIAKKTSKNKSSMLQDMEEGEKTEVDQLSGEIIRKAKEHGVSVPTIRALHDLIHIAEED